MISTLDNRQFPRTAASLFLALAFALVLIVAVPRPAVADVQFTVTGGGWGHGIGMSQWGAAGYASRGMTYDWIIAHYYLGSRIVTMPEQPTVKVNLNESAAGRSSWQVMSGSSSTLKISQTTSAGVSVSVSPTSVVTIATAAGSTRVLSGAGVLLKSFSGGCTVSSTGGFVQIVTASGPFSQTNVVWRGTVRFVPTSTTSTLSKAVNYVPIEQYLCGVVPRELGSSFPTEALKAQAVAARSYAWQDAYEGNTLYCTTMSQVYNGRGRWNSTHTGTITLHETTKTNGAVIATTGKVAWYGTESEPIQTFFSSSSGGRTAGITDVWVGSTARPYYTSVVDADQASPDYAWAPATVSGAAFAAALRDRDNGSSGTDPLEYSAPAPAVVTGFSFERAASGFVRYVTVLWSNGKSYRINGTTLQSAMRFKSSKYYIAGPPAVIPRPTTIRYQENDLQARTGGGAWGTWRNYRLSGGAHAFTKYKGRYMTFKFYGTAFRWIGGRHSSFGRAAVYVDGVRRATVSQYAARTAFQQGIWSISGLAPDKVHTVVIRALGTKVSASSSTVIAVDAVDVTGGSLLTPFGTRFESTAATCTGTWVRRSTTWASADEYVYSQSPTDLATLSFTGRGVRLIGTRGRAAGKAYVSLDAGPWVLVDTYGAATVYQSTLWDSGVVGYGAHTLRIKPAGARNAASSANVIVLDAFDVR